MTFLLIRSWSRKFTSSRIPHHVLRSRPYSCESSPLHVPTIEFLSSNGRDTNRVAIPQPPTRIPCLTPHFGSQPKLLEGGSVDLGICTLYGTGETLSGWEGHIVAIAHSIQLIKRRLKWRDLVLRSEHLYSAMSLSNCGDNLESVEILRREHRMCVAKIREVEGYEEAIFKYSEDVRSVLEVDPELAEKKIDDIEEALLKMRRDLKKKEVKALVSGDHDSCSCFIEVLAGPGGRVSMESAAMIINMYKAWARRHGFGVTLVDERRGEIAGIERATIKVDGECAFGYAKAEVGVHRLEYIPSFDSQRRLRTSLAAVVVMPILDDCRYQINESDLKIEGFCAAGAGGQHRTDNALRIVHIPTNVSATCQNQRSQLQNKAIAMALLQCRLDQLVMTSRQQLNATEPFTKTNWANQIRSYCLHPNPMVKDLRTDYEVSKPDSVLQGDLDGLIYSVLSKPLDEDKKQGCCVLYYD